jgi:predicted membrane-bound mannosyltransferase
VLYTTLFSNLPGILSGLFGALGYWLGQHDVRRGDQPWFYYLILMPQYELIACLFGAAMTVVTGVRVVRFWLGRQAGGIGLLTHAFLAYWAAATFFILSWAGEKMPWLIVHITVPYTLLAAGLLGELVERLLKAAPSLSAGGMAWAARHRRGLALGYAGLVGLIATLFVHGAGQASHAETPQPLPVAPALVALALTTIGYALLVGYRRAGVVACLVGAVLLSLLQVRLGWIASFVHADIPKEQLIYVQTSRDVSRVMAEIERLSEELTGGKTMTIIYDGGEFGIAWPFEWYLRDFKNKRYFADGPNADPGPDVPVVLIGSGNRSRAEPFLGDYEATEYVLRWHYPEEETYRPFAIAPELRPGRSAWRTPEQPHGPVEIAASVWSSLAVQADPAEQARLWRYFMNREPYAPVGSFNFILYVRKDILRHYNGLRY